MAAEQVKVGSWAPAATSLAAPVTLLMLASVSTPLPAAGAEESLLKARLGGLDGLIASLATAVDADVVAIR